MAVFFRWRLAEEEMVIKSENKNNGSVNLTLTFPNEDSDVSIQLV